MRRREEGEKGRREEGKKGRREEGERQAWILIKMDGNITKLRKQFNLLQFV